VLVGILLVMVGIFYVTGTGFLGAKYRLVTYLPEVEGLTSGAKVTLDGVEVGNVDSIQVAKPKSGVAPDTKRSVEVILRVSRDFQNDIRSDSTASLLTEGFLGDASSPAARLHRRSFRMDRKFRATRKIPE